MKNRSEEWEKFQKEMKIYKKGKRKGIIVGKCIAFNALENYDSHEPTTEEHYNHLKTYLGSVRDGFDTVISRASGVLDEYIKKEIEAGIKIKELRKSE